MKKIKNILVLLILLTVMVVLISEAFRHPAPNNSAPLNNNNYTQLEIYDTLFSKSQAEKLKLLGSDKINLEGKVLTSNFLKNDEIVVYRIVITCCVADGVPLGIVVKMPPNFAKTLHDKDWVNVEGTLKLLSFNQINQRLHTSDLFVNMVLPDKSIPYFVANKAVKTATAPGDEYLYP
jgi:uncharacterized membrane protein YcgQ (UPF0703/DUF1980 family)